MTFHSALLAGALALTLPSSAHAGAWPREEGQYFVAIGGNFLLSDGARLPVHYDPTLYLEYGLDGRVTLGADYYTADAGRITSGFGFVSIPLSTADATDKFAATLGLGVKLKQGEDAESQLRGGLSWGRGIDSGWLAVDASAKIGTNDRLFRPKLDATWGHHWSNDWTTSLQLQTGQGASSDYYAKIAPSITYNLTDNAKVHLGIVHALTGDRGTGAKAEIWYSF